jgi:hypothetical protein
MSKQIPRGHEGLVCPLHKKPMETVCHKCPWWVHVRGANPQTGAEIDEWNCAIAWGPTLAINTAQQVRQGAAATESFRNEMVSMAKSRRLGADERVLMINGGSNGA